MKKNKDFVQRGLHLQMVLAKARSLLQKKMDADLNRAVVNGEHVYKTVCGIVESAEHLNATLKNIFGFDINDQLRRSMDNDTYALICRALDFVINDVESKMEQPQ